VGTTCVLCGAIAREEGLHDALGFCQPCAKGLPSIEALLESMDVPAALVSRDLVVLSANRRLYGLTRDGGMNAIGIRIGLALGCAHAEVPGPCGQTEACLECWLRRSVDLARICDARVPWVRWDFLPHAGHRTPYAISAVKTREAVVLTLKPAGAGA